MESDAGNSQPILIWAVTDGRAGNEAQALGLAEAVARAVPARVETRHVTPSPLAAKLPARAWDWLARLLPGWPEAGLARGVAPPLPPWPDLAIGAGRRAAPFVAALGRRGAATVQILDPQMNLGAFDRVVAPEHDGLDAPNAIATIGSVGRITPARVAEAAAALAPRLAHLPARRVAVLIGGTGPSAQWSTRDVEELVARLAALSRAGWGLVVTASRRTDPAVIPALEAACDPARTFLFDGTGENPYPGMLGLVEAVLVTEDSVNMVSEAASTGLPVHVFRVAEASAKARGFHAAMAARGITRDFEGEIGTWSYAPLAEADRVAGLLVAAGLAERRG